MARVGLVMLVGMVLSATLAAPDVRAESSLQQGPWIDEIVWSEEQDPTKALEEVINGSADIFTFPFRSRAEKERASSSDVGRFATYQLLDEVTLNPVEQDQRYGHPRNPFAIRAVREAMHYLIDRDFIVQQFFGGFAIPMKTLWHPRSADYARSVGDLIPLEFQYAFNPAKGRDAMFAALHTEGWTIAPDGFWHDPEGRLVVINVLTRFDERYYLGTHYTNILTGLGFKASLFGALTCPYGCAPDQNSWHVYTAGWLRPSALAWDDDNLRRFTACGIGEPWCTPGGPFYDPPDALKDIAETLAQGQYIDLRERQLLIAQGSAIAMAEAMRIFIAARETLYVYNPRVEGFVFDLFEGPGAMWGMRTARVPPDVDGLRRLRPLNWYMFGDSWNPWVFPGWSYDDIVRDQFIDPGMARHPHTARLIDWRTSAAVQTAGPTGKLDVPSDAVVFDVATNRFGQVGTGVQATSKVSLDFLFGKWHHGPDITMDDVLYDWANTWRRSSGDISQVPGLRNTASAATKDYIANVVKGIRVIDSDTLEVYINAWHVDGREIAALGSGFPRAPWEVQEIAAKLLLDQVAAIHDADARMTGRIWLDLTRGDSIPPLQAAMVDYSAANHIPPGMATGAAGVLISTAEAAARWNALQAWYAVRRHFWPSNGPFFLDSVDIANRTVALRPFREYVFSDGFLERLTEVRVPKVAFRPAASAFFSGEPITLDLRVSIGPELSDEVDMRWLLRDVARNTFVTSGVPTWRATGQYRVTVPERLPAVYAGGSFDLILAAVGREANVPVADHHAFGVYPGSGWYEDAFRRFYERVGRALERYRGLLLELDRVRVEVADQARVLALAQGLLIGTGVASLAAVGLSTFSLYRLARRLRRRRRMRAP